MPATAARRCRIRVTIELTVLPELENIAYIHPIVKLRNESNQRQRPAIAGTFAVLVAAVR
jgi:hypothetical protein